MGENSRISWTDHTFNPWIGCSKVSAGCDNCYAERNFGLRLGKATWGPSGTRIVTNPDYWKQPLRWNRNAEKTGTRPKVFCASLADVFEDRPDLIEPRERLWRLILATPALDWLVLTKRPENIAWMLPAYMPNYIAEAGLMNQEEIRENLWLGTTVEDQAAADERIPELMKIPAAVRFLSCEPLLESIEPLSIKFPGQIDWVIVGCESGPNRRPCSLDWVRSLRDRCQVDGVPVFIKQLDIGGQVVKELDQFPDDLRIREVPQ